MKRIAHGPAATLYSYTDEIKTRFYIFAPGYTKPLELGYGVVRDGQTLSENFEYRDMLTRTAETAGTLNKKLRGEIKRAQYKDFELIRLVNQINGVEAAATEEKSLKKSGHSFNAGVGVVFGKYVFYSDTDLGKKGVGSFNPGPSVTIGYDIAANPRVGKLFFRACLQYSIVEYTGKTYNDNFIDAEIHMKQQFTQSNFSYGLAAAYNVVNTDRLKFYISAGARAFNAKHDYKYTLTTVRSSGNTVANSQAGQPRKGWINAQLSAGVFLKKRLEISATYWPRVAMSPLTFQYTYGISMTEMAVRYHLIRQR